MHELALTQAIVAAVAERAGERRVSRVVLEVGTLAGVMTDAVDFAFDLVSEGTVLEGADLTFAMIEARGRCRACGAAFVQETLYHPCACGSHDVERLSGDELTIRQFELAEVPDTGEGVRAQAASGGPYV